MPVTTPFKRLILRTVLRNVSPMVIRLVSVSDRTDLPGLHDVFHAILGWSGDLGYLVRVHGQEFNSLRRSTRSKALRDFQLLRQKKFLYVYDVMDLWEWEIRVLGEQEIPGGLRS
jgi:Plasmid pRiA4b ORF-3-like protein